MNSTEMMREALEDIVRHCKKNGMQDWPIAVKARAALAQAEQRQVVPAGWRLVPIEPTEEMIDAYVAVTERFPSARTDWAVMLASAPQSEEPKQCAPGMCLEIGEFIPAEELNKARNKE